MSHQSPFLGQSISNQATTQHQHANDACKATYGVVYTVLACLLGMVEQISTDQNFDEN